MGLNNKNKQIIFVTEHLHSICGVARVITNWSNYFIKSQQVENVSISKGKPYFNLDEKVKHTIVDFKFKYKIFKLIDIITNTIKMYKFLKQRQNTNIIFNKSLYIEPIWILRKLRLFKNINLIYFSHDGSSGFNSFYLARKIIKYRVTMLFNAFDKVICLHDDEQNYPLQVKKEKLFFVPNPVSFTSLNISYTEKENIVLSLGRVIKTKGIDTLINAWDKISKTNKNWKLQIVGDGEHKEEFKQKTQKLSIKNIEFIDGTPKTQSLYEKAKIFVIPSIAEGFGMTILEAMACKCCVISSKTAGGNKLVNDGKTGLLFDVDDVAELTNKIFILIHNQTIREKLSNNAFKYIKEYEIENIAKNWRGILN